MSKNKKVTLSKGSSLLGVIALLVILPIALFALFNPKSPLNSRAAPVTPPQTPTPIPSPTPSPTPVPKNSFTVETFLKKPDGSKVRFTKVNAKTIVRYMEASGKLTKPRVCYQGNNDGQCPITNNCMLNGYLNIAISDKDKPCTKLKKGWYSTHWDKSVVVDGVTYKLTYPNKNCADKVCTQEEFINSGTPYHYGIYEKK